MPDRQGHWNQVYRTKASDRVSWFQSSAAPSLRWIAATGLGAEARVIDVGGGASPLAGDLLAKGWNGVSVLDIAQSGLDVARAPLGAEADRVTWLTADVLDWRPEADFDLWHDRAVFHFLTEPDQRALYHASLEAGLKPGGWLVMATFAPDGPERCSDLPAQRWSAEALAAELGPGFTLVDHARETHRTPGGADQPFTWTLFRRN